MRNFNISRGVMRHQQQNNLARFGAALGCSMPWLRTGSRFKVVTALYAALVNAFLQARVFNCLDELSATRLYSWLIEYS